MSGHTPERIENMRGRLIERIAGRLEREFHFGINDDWDQDIARGVIDGAMPVTDSEVQNVLESGCDMAWPRSLSVSERLEVRRRLLVKKAAPQLLEACKAAHAAYELWGPPEDPTPQDLAEHEGEYVALAGLATHLAAAIAAAEGE